MELTPIYALLKEMAAQIAELRVEVAALNQQRAKTRDRMRRFRERQKQVVTSLKSPRKPVTLQNGKSLQTEAIPIGVPRASSEVVEVVAVAKDLSAAASPSETHPETAKDVQLRFPCDDRLLERIVTAAQKAYPGAEDSLIAEAVRVATKPNQQGAGLYLHTVPALLASHAKRKPPQRETYIDPAFLRAHEEALARMRARGAIA